MNSRLFLSIVTLGLLANPSFAGNMGADVPQKDWAWVGSIAAGAVWGSGGEAQTIDLTPTIVKTYMDRKSTNAFAAGEMFLGIQKTLAAQWLGQLGLAAATTGNAKIQGVIWDDADPRFNNHSYQYKVQNSRVAVKGKLLLDKGYWAMPWVSASVGVGFNHAHGFTNTPLISEAIVNPYFANNTKTAFTYTLGAGVQKSINNHLQVGVGYEFADFGKSQLGSAPQQSLNSGLALKHLYTNGVLFNLTYVS